MAAMSAIRVERQVAAEEAARGDYYALLGRFFGRAPDGQLLASLAAAGPLPEGGRIDLARAWRDLTAAASAMDALAAEEEYDALFGGVGKSAVSLYAGAYARATAVEHPRVRIQRDLAAAGLAHQAPNEPEDHFAALFDAMRVLAAGGPDRAPAPIAQQRAFFESHVKPAAPKFFAVLATHPKSNFYRCVGALGQAFLQLESESFSLD